MEALVHEFVENLSSLARKGILQGGDLVRHTKTNAHPSIVYATLEAGRRIGYMAVPEYKIWLTQPLSLPNRKNRWFSKVDVAYLTKDGTLEGIGECFTIDEAGHFLPSTADEIRNRERLLHMADQNPNIFMLIAVVLPREVREKPGWNDALRSASRDFLSSFKEGWERLAGELGQMPEG